MSDASVEVLIVRLDPELAVPVQAHAHDAGVDLRARVDVQLKPGERTMIPTGVAVAVPAGYAGLVQPRSGLAAKHGLGIVNSPGLIDAGYRGEINVIAINLDPSDPISIARGDRVAQLVIYPVPAVTWREVSELPSSERGEAGFGSSGT